MFNADQYELLDVGDGRRLERFGQYILDRPAPAAAELSCRTPTLWKKADARFTRRSATVGTWAHRTEMPTTWLIRHEKMLFELKCTDSGAIGIYPEQATNWDWIAKQVRRADRPLKILNLFAYSGGSTLAAANAGAEVVHVDAARSVVNWARRNAERAGLQDAPIRWITEDACKFAEREVRREVQYDAVILDPPTYGHGPKAQPWKLSQHLDSLLRLTRVLTRRRRAFVLLTCHTPGFGPAELEAMLAENLWGHCRSGVMARRLFLKDPCGQRLASGVVVRWPGE